MHLGSLRFVSYLSRHMLFCLLSRRILWIFFSCLLWEFCIEFWWIFSGLRLPRNEARKILEKFRENSEQNSGQNSGRLIQKIRETFVLRLSWPKHMMTVLHATLAAHPWSWPRNPQNKWCFQALLFKVPKGPFGTKNAIALRIVVKYYRGSILLSVPIRCHFSQENSISELLPPLWITIAVANYCHGSDLLRRSVFSTAGSFG